jgi:hypothetical protein
MTGNQRRHAVRRERKPAEGFLDLDQSPVPLPILEVEHLQQEEPPMTDGELLYLLMAIGAAALFVVTLAWSAARSG